MSHSHDHNHGDIKGFKLLLSILLNIFITLAQVAGGIFSGSLALLTDALHNFSDVLALVISWIANRLSLKEYTPEKTFGYKRAEILAALINAGALILIAVFLIRESVERLFNPEPLGSVWVIVLGGLSILLNGLSVLLIKKEAEDSLNMKSAYLHLFTDMMTSVAVMLGGILIHFTGITLVDPILSIGIALYLIYSSTDLLLKTLRVLMQFTPKGIDPAEIAREVRKIDGVENMHHMHIWQLTDKLIHLEGHVEISDDPPLHQVQEILDSVSGLLNHRFGISHTVLQPGSGCCGQTGPTVTSEEEHCHSHDHDHDH